MEKLMITDNEKTEILNRLKSIDDNVHALCVILADGLKELVKLMEKHDDRE